MAWRDTVTPAKLDDISFYFKSVETGIGRRGALHEFPNRDKPFVEDMGRHAREYNIQAFVIGPNYPVERDRLMEVIEAGGDHIFNHPYHGVFTVKVMGRVSIVETDDEGGMARFDGLRLCESGLAFPQVTFDSIARIQYVATDVQTKLAVKTKMRTLGALGAVLASIANGLQAASTAMRKVNGQVSAGLGTIDNITASINEFEKEMLLLMQAPDQLMGKLTAMATAAFNLIKEFLPPIPTVDVMSREFYPAELTLNVLEDLFQFESIGDAIPTPTEQSFIEQDAHAAITDTLKAAAVSSAAVTLSSIEIDSSDQATQALTSLVSKLDVLVATDFDTVVVEALLTLKAAVVQHFTLVAADLPRVSRHKPNYTAPALVLASNLYGSADGEQDLIRRNRIRHPGFVPAGVVLEVLRPE